MADNSIREQLILRVIEELGTISWVKQIKRVRPTMDDLASRKGEGADYATTMLPLITVEAGLPKPIEKKSSRTPGKLDIFKSELGLEIFCYVLENESPDSIISNYLDDLWVKLQEDPLKDDLCIETIIKPKVEKLVFLPYTAFSIDVTLTYLHTTQNI